MDCQVEVALAGLPGKGTCRRRKGVSTRVSVLIISAVFISLTAVLCDGSGLPEPPKYTGDLPELRSRGLIRFIVRPDAIDHIPRNAEPVELDHDIAKGIAKSLKMELRMNYEADHAPRPEFRKIAGVLGRFRHSRTIAKHSG